MFRLARLRLVAWSDASLNEIQRSFAVATVFVLVACQAIAGMPEQESGARVPRKSANRLLVVAPMRLLPSLTPFIKHKSTLLDAAIKPLEEILAAESGVDDAEKLKRFLYTQWREHDLTYVLLVGDADALPVRYMTLDRKHEPAFNYSFYPSDLYYADLANADGSFEDWNAIRDSFHAQYFGEVRGETNKDDPINYDQVDYAPEIAVGRWPVSTPEETNRVADKSIRYERQVLSNDSPHLRRAAFLSVSGWVDTRTWSDDQARKFGGWAIEKRYSPRKGQRDSETPPPTREEVLGLLDRGMGLVVHTGHGRPNRWEKCFSVSDLDESQNAASLPIVISAGCSTAHFATLPPYEPYADVRGEAHRGTDHGEKFDSPPPPPANYQTGKHNPDGLGEEFLKRSDNGAVAYIGCNTGSQPCGLVLVDGLLSAIASAKEPRLGPCWSEAVAFYYQNQRLATLAPNESWYPASIFFQPMKFMLFGDPSLRLPATDPKPEKVSGTFSP